MSSAANNSSGKRASTGWPAWLPPGMRRLAEVRDPQVLRADVMAGISVALLLIPQAMAFAQLAGLPAQAGLYAALLPPVFAALFGSSRQMVTGPVSLISLMTFAALAPLVNGNGELAWQAAMLLAAMVGIIQIGLGLLRLGVLVDFLSHPVVIGFTNAGVIIIATAQMGKLFGISAEKGAWHFQTVWNMIKTLAAHGPHWPTLFMAIFSFALIIAVRRWRAHWPGVLIAVAAATLLAWLTGYAAAGGKVIGAIPAALPSLALPPLDAALAAQLLPSAIVIALLGYLEAISIARALAAKTRQRISANQELFGQGAGNLAAAFSGGYPVSASFSRSAVNLDNGGRTPFSAITSAVVIALVLLLLTPLLYHLPQAALAAVIIMAVAGLFHLAPIRRAWQVEKHDGIVALATFVLTLISAPRLEIGIFGGILLSMALFIYRTMRPRVALLARLEDGRLADAHLYPSARRCERVLLVRHYLLLYYANAGHFENRLLHLLAEYPRARFVILDLSAVNMIDSSGVDVLADLRRRLAAHGIELLLARANHHVRSALQRAGLLSAHTGNADAIRLFDRPTQAICFALSHVQCPDCDNGRYCPLRRQDYAPPPCPATDDAANAPASVSADNGKPSAP